MYTTCNLFFLGILYVVNPLNMHVGIQLLALYLNLSVCFLYVPIA